MVIAEISQSISNAFTLMNEQVPEQYKPLVILALYTLIIVIYAIFIWKFYKFLARRNIIELNLSQYNRTAHPTLNKIFASGLFLLEYLIITPILVFFWFSILAVALLLLSKSQSVDQILLISAAIVAAVRLASYYSQDLAKDLAKMFPFTVLAVFLLDPQFFVFEKFIERFSEISPLLSNILIYLIFIIALEIIMRSLFTIVDLFLSREETV